MENVSAVFIGFKTFLSPKSNKVLSILSFVIITPDEVNQKVDYFVKDVFVSEKEYQAFIDNHGILEAVDLKREIVGDQVRYYVS